MGWKALKDAYGITHNVCVTSVGICIGSGYVHDLVVVDPVSGRVRENEAFGRILSQYYPALAEASPAEILGQVQAEDTFEASIPVYTYEGAEIIEKRCEVLGWPNTTHDGDLMYDNKYSADRDVVIGWAKRSAMLEAKHLGEAIERLQIQLCDLQNRLASARTCRVRLDAEHPAVPATEY
ncbi:hypothetical protein PSOLE_35730 [Pseudomonas oleovorans subsp. oleovorans]|uniref:Uncharacterized protein n=1 Tax=Ectopseudomonas oleovorans TaxID=301 RepID=A0A379PI17_ECTOL|nr:hypothetical protein [Pseudomonas oleovorans]OWK41170.1 hypothetical protein PSOLE_35730 [Pseudomonas oleovorans subsp. oleovorans]SEJ64185.1 hypothetical protein SAMN05216280_103344 [Pseudomonas oleovorans]SUE72440.1 Uncharacterised protein [Pseudomonas oleovorans]